MQVPEVLIKDKTDEEIEALAEKLRDAALTIAERYLRRMREAMILFNIEDMGHDKNGMHIKTREIFFDLHPNAEESLPPLQMAAWQDQETGQVQVQILAWGEVEEPDETPDDEPWPEDQVSPGSAGADGE